MTPKDNTKLEVETREEIDQKLSAAEWVVQDKIQAAPNTPFLKITG